MIITSKSNKTVSFVNSLKNKKARKESGLYIVEGKKMLREAFIAGKKVKTVVLSESAQLDFPLGNAEVLTVSDGVFSYLSDEVTPQGVLAVIARDEEFPSGTGSVSILLDGLQDPGNMGTIIRTAAAVGVKDLYLANCCDPFSPKVVRSSMSGIYSVKLHFIDRSEIGEVFSSVELIAADMGGENVFGYKPQGDFCVAVGNEANGLSEETKRAADKIASIPMTKNAESLNVGVALSVMLYELVAGADGKIIGRR